MSAKYYDSDRGNGLYHEMSQYDAPMLQEDGGFLGSGDDTDAALNALMGDEEMKDRYDDFDFDRVADTHAIDADDAGEHEGAPMPPGRSWVLWSVTIPNRLALLTLISIGIYEVLVAVSMGVKSLRSLMVNGLMHGLLVINVCLLLALTFLVVKARAGLTFEFITDKLKGEKRIQEDEDPDER